MHIKYAGSMFAADRTAASIHRRNDDLPFLETGTGAPRRLRFGKRGLVSNGNRQHKIGPAESLRHGVSCVGGTGCSGQGYHPVVSGPRLCSFWQTLSKSVAIASETNVPSLHECPRLQRTPTDPLCGIWLCEEEI